MQDFDMMDVPRSLFLVPYNYSAKQSSGAPRCAVSLYLSMEDEPTSRQRIKNTASNNEGTQNVCERVDR